MNVALVSLSGTITEVHYLNGLTQAILSCNEISKVCLFIPGYTDVNTLPKEIKIYAIEPYKFIRSPFKAIIKSLNPNIYRRIYKEIDAFKPDVIHIPFEFRVSYLFLSKLKRKYPIVSTIHEPYGTLTSYKRKFLLNPIQNMNTNYIVKNSNKIIVHGDKHKNFYIKKGVSEKKIRIIEHVAVPYPYDVTLLPTQKRNILFFGKIRENKGIDNLIKACKTVSQQYPDITITIAGEGDFSYYDRIIGNDDHFIVHNRFIPDEEITTLFSEATVLVLPYTEGSQSGIISIAAQFKKPVIVTDVGHLSQMVIDGKSGFVVPRNNNDALVKAIITLLSNYRLREEMGIFAYEFIKEKHSASVVGIDVVNVYKEAIDSRKYQN